MDIVLKILCLLDFFYNREKDNRKVSNKKIVLFEIGAALVVFFFYSGKKFKVLVVWFFRTIVGQTLVPDRYIYSFLKVKMYLLYLLEWQLVKKLFFYTS